MTSEKLKYVFKICISNHCCNNTTIKMSAFAAVTVAAATFSTAVSSYDHREELTIQYTCDESFKTKEEFINWFKKNAKLSEQTNRKIFNDYKYKLEFRGTNWVYILYIDGSMTDMDAIMEASST